MKNKGLVATIVIMSGVIVTLLVILLVINMPTIISISDIKEKMIERVVEQTKASEEYHETETIKIDVPEITTDIKTYEGYNGAVSIEYPEISGLDDLDQQDRINKKIKMNALSIVSLYPVSTALQKLNINCEIDYLDKKYITIIYSGMLVGNDVNKNTVTYKDVYETSYTPKVSNANDPYLNGFVDPLANKNNIGINTNVNRTQTNNFNTNVDLPLPKETQAVGNVIGNVSGNQKVSRGGGPSANNTSTVDGGPTVNEIKSPTAKPKGGAAPTTNQVVPGEQITQNVPISNSNSGVSVYSYSTSTSKITNTNQKIYFTNTIDLENNTDFTLSNYGDIETFAKYARSSDAEYVNVDSSKRTEVREYIRKTPLTTLIEDLKKSDFRNEALTTWPKHFSYQDKDGNIYFTIKLTTKLGNYVIIKYSK